MRQVLADSWYAPELEATTLEEAARGRIARRALRWPITRGALLWWLGKQYPVVLVTLAGRSTRSLLLLERLLGRRRRYLVVLEFIPVMREEHGEWSRASRTPALLRRLYWDRVVAPVLRRCLLVAHSLTRWEVERNARAFGLEADRLVFIPWFASMSASYAATEPGPRHGVLASGRAACDWETVFACARDAEWPLTVVCSRTDLARVTALNAGGRATVLCEVLPSEHARLMRTAAVYLLALREAAVSSGQIRVMDATSAGTPLVASAVRGLADYLVPNETALTFPPGDARGAREAVTRVYADSMLAGVLAANATRLGLAWGRSDYLRAIGELVARATTEALTQDH